MSDQGDYLKSIEAAMVRQELVYSDVSHALFGFFRDLTLEQKSQLQVLLCAIAGSSAPGAVANYYAGALVAYMDSMHGHCPSCGKNHANEFQEIVDADEGRADG